MSKALIIFACSVVATAVIAPTIMKALNYAGISRSIVQQNATFVATAASKDSIHDLAVVGIQTLGWVDVTREKPSVTESVLVGIQNRSNHDERIDDNIHLGDGVTTGLVRLKIAVIDDDNEGCEPAKVVIRKRAPLAGGPKFLIKPMQSYGVGFDVTYRCTAAKPRDSKDPSPWDYSHTATVHHEVLDSNRDADPSDDICPRQPIPPKREVQDRGCGRGLRGQLLGPEVVDVVLKPGGDRK